MPTDVHISLLSDLAGWCRSKVSSSFSNGTQPLLAVFRGFTDPFQKNFEKVYRLNNDQLRLNPLQLMN
jgi:hypothetical protein